MNKLSGYLLLGAFFLLAPWSFAQDADQSSSDSGVLVSPPIHAQGSDQDSAGNNESNDAPSLSDRGSSNNPGHKGHRQGNSDGGVSDSSTDEIIIKSTNNVMSQITENMKLTPGQISAIQPVIQDNIIRVRDLQLSLEKGAIDGKAMYSQRKQLIDEENRKLNSIFTPDQMKIWVNIQNE
jgi:hypothetical protein